MVGGLISTLEYLDSGVFRRVSRYQKTVFLTGAEAVAGFGQDMLTNRCCGGIQASNQIPLYKSLVSAVSAPGDQKYFTMPVHMPTDRNFARTFAAGGGTLLCPVFGSQNTEAANRIAQVPPRQ